MRSEVPNPVVLNLPPGFHLDPDPTVAGFQQLVLDYLRDRAYYRHQPFTQGDYMAKLDWQGRRESSALCTLEPAGPQRGAAGWQSADFSRTGGPDVRTSEIVGGILELRSYASLPSLAKHILSHWQLRGILTAQSGLPYSGLVSYDLNNDGNSEADRTPGLGRNTFHMPATASLSPRVTRIVPLPDRVRLMIAWEAFNVFNRPNLSHVNRTQSAYVRSPAVCGIAGTPCLNPLAPFGTPAVAAAPPDHAIVSQGHFLVLMNPSPLMPRPIRP